MTDKIVNYSDDFYSLLFMSPKTMAEMTYHNSYIQTERFTYRTHNNVTDELLCSEICYYSFGPEDLI